MDILHEVLGFAAKGFVVFATVAACVVFFLAVARRKRPAAWLRVKPLNKQIDALGDALRVNLMRKKDFRKLRKGRKKARAPGAAAKPNVFVLEFKGDLFATAVRNLREEITAIATVAGKGDEVVIRLESAGGAVPHYGLAAAQLMRLRDKAIKVTVCIDRIAASGGYMMACVADEIIAAPFAIIGSIGVVAEVPNLHRLLKKHDVDFQEMTAGEFKRTVSVFGEITEKGRKKFQEELEDTHLLFKDFVKAHRPKLDVDRVATGEHWLARRGLELGLVDQIGTSDDYLVGRAAIANLYQVSFQRIRSLRERLGSMAASALDWSLSSLTWLLLVAWIPAAAAAPRTFSIDGNSSSASAHVGKTGIGSFAGHEHTVLAQTIQGEVILDREQLSRSSVDLVVSARSLKVSEEGEPEGDAPKVQRAMRGADVLDVARYGTIHFRSVEVTAKPAGPSSYDLTVLGELSLHGVTKPCTVPVRLEIQGEALSATGKMVVKQTDFGIQPTSAAGGLVKVEDEVTLTFRIAARAAP